MKHKNELKFNVVRHHRASEYDWMNIDLGSKRVGKVRGRTGQTSVIIYSINIFPEFERRGYATRTLAMIKKHFDSITADRVRPTARAFWEKMGFQDTQDGNFLWEKKGK